MTDTQISDLIQARQRVETITLSKITGNEDLRAKGEKEGSCRHADLGLSVGHPIQVEAPRW